MRDPELLERAKQMRAQPTAAEQRLWLALRARRFSVAKFRRQVVIGRYIADFACRTPTKVVVELDGDSHDFRAGYDERRTTFLEEQGYRVLRFANSDVMQNMDGVLFAISEALPTPPLPGPLP